MCTELPPQPSETTDHEPSTGRSVTQTYRADRLRRTGRLDAARRRRRPPSRPDERRAGHDGTASLTSPTPWVRTFRPTLRARRPSASRHDHPRRWLLHATLGNLRAHRDPRRRPGPTSTRTAATSPSSPLTADAARRGRRHRRPCPHRPRHRRHRRRSPRPRAAARPHRRRRRRPDVLRLGRQGHRSRGLPRQRRQWRPATSPGSAPTRANGCSTPPDPRPGRRHPEHRPRGVGDLPVPRSSNGAERYGVENLANLRRLPTRDARITVGVIPFKLGSGGPPRSSLPGASTGAGRGRMITTVSR